MATGTSTNGRSRFTTYLLTAGVIVALLLGGISAYSALHPSIPAPSAPTTVWNNETVYRNSTVYENTTTNVTTPIWHNSTYYVNTTVDTTKTVYLNSTFYITTTIVELIPVVNVTGVGVTFTNASLGTNYTIPTYANYSLPIGTVTWVEFTLNATRCDAGFSVAVDSPWTLISTTDSRSAETITVIALLGVPYFPGTYGIDLVVSE